MKNKTFKVIFFNILFIFILLFAFETILRFFSLSQIQGYRVELINESLPKIKKNTEGIVLGKKIYVDQNGYRIPFKNFNYQGNEKVFFLGDSVTFGVGVKEEDSFVGIYRKNFDNKKIYNLSLFGYQVSHYSQQFDEIKKLLPAKKIIYFITLNDVYDSSNIKVNKFLENRQNTGFRKIFNIDLFKKINFFLREKSFLFTFLKGITLDSSKSWFQNVLGYYKQNDLSNMKSFLNTFNKFSIDNNIQSYIFLLPYEFQTRKCDSEQLYPQNKLKIIANEINKNIFDLTSNFCQYKNPKRLFLKYDPMHLSVEGHRFVYELTKKKIYENE